MQCLASEFGHISPGRFWCKGRGLACAAPGIYSRCPLDSVRDQILLARRRIAGEPLSRSVDRLAPSPSPDDPVFEAQCAIIDRERQGLSFSKLSLPMATTRHPPGLRTLDSSSRVIAGLSPCSTAGCRPKAMPTISYALCHPHHGFIGSKTSSPSSMKEVRDEYHQLAHCSRTNMSWVIHRRKGRQLSVCSILP